MKENITEIQISQFFDTFFSNKIVLISTLLFTLISSFVYLNLAPKIYISKATLSESSSTTPQNANPLLGLVGIEQVGASKSNYAIRKIKSLSFFKVLITSKPEVLSILLDREFVDSSLTDDHSTKLIINQAFNLYLKRLTLLSKSGFFEISFEHKTPNGSFIVLTNILHEINSFMLEKEIHESDVALRFLAEKINETQVIEIRQSLSKLMQVQLERQMTAKMKQNYVFEELDSPAIPLSHSKPNSFIVLFFSMFGAIFFLIVITLYKIYKKSNKQQI